MDQFFICLFVWFLTLFFALVSSRFPATCESQSSSFIGGISGWPRFQHYGRWWMHTISNHHTVVVFYSMLIPVLIIVLFILLSYSLAHPSVGAANGRWCRISFETREVALLHWLESRREELCWYKYSRWSKFTALCRDFEFQQQYQTRCGHCKKLRRDDEQEEPWSSNVLMNK